MRHQALSVPKWNIPVEIVTVTTALALEWKAGGGLSRMHVRDLLNIWGLWV